MLNLGLASRATIYIYTMPHLEICCFTFVLVRIPILYGNCNKSC